MLRHSDRSQPREVMTDPRKPFDIANAIIASGIGILTLVVYWLTKAPTLSLWDCGEFIAASSILGVPHPPGTPLYILVGRIFSLLPLASDVSARVNLLSSIPSAFTAVFGYLAAARILRRCVVLDDARLGRLLVYAGAAAGAFFLAFSLTHWNNSVEAEVYGLAMMMLVAIVWLALIYWENAGTAFGQRVLLLMFFIAFAGVGVHMTTYLAIPGVACLFLIRKDAPRRIWFMVGAFVLLELYLIFAMSSRPGEIPYYIPVLIVLVFYLFYIFSYDRIPALHLALAGGLLVSALPIAGMLVGSTQPSTDPPSVTAWQILTVVGQVSLIGMVALALYFLYRYRRHKDIAPNQLYVIPSLFIVAAGFMTLVLALDIKGYHAFLVATAILGSVLVVILRRHLNWLTLVATVSVSTVMLGVGEMFFGIVIGALAILVAGLVFRAAGWKNALMILMVAVLGYSVHLYIPIRSARQPVINENNPSESLTATINYIERKQYGSESMTSKMFKRRGEWGNQFGGFRRMGFWNFFHEQYGLTGPRFVPLFIIGLYGLWETIRRRPQYGIPLFILVLLASVGLVLYMNFADGTRQHPVTGLDYIEVRDRDYFFTPAFLLFGTAIGLGLAGVIQFAAQAALKSKQKIKRVLVVLMLVLFLLPGYTLAKNYYFADRSRNYIAFDYAWNILISADPDAVLITAGDNDTFPLWCLQEAYNIRKDVDVVNLSLANAKWYIKQLKYTLGIDMRWNESHIDSLVPFRDQYGHVHRLPDQTVNEIISSSLGRRPINFAYTVPPSGRQFFGRSIDSLLTRQGAVWRLDTAYHRMTVDVETSIDLLTNPAKMRFRSVADQSVYKSETALRLTKQYLQSFMLVADTLTSRGDFERAEWIITKGLEAVPYSSDGINYLAALYAEQAKRDVLNSLIDTTRYGDIPWLRTLAGRLEMEHGQPAQAEAIFTAVLADYPTYRAPMEDLLRLYYGDRDLDRLRSVLQTWLRHNPDDPEARELFNSINRQMNRSDPVGDNDS
jgi:hypothetical protein